jgi:hypothetical protein
MFFEKKIIFALQGDDITRFDGKHFPHNEMVCTDAHMTFG